MDIESKFISSDFIYEKLFDTPQRSDVLKEIIDSKIYNKILNNNSDLLKCGCGFILSREQEYHLFRKYNYLKYRINKISKDKKTGSSKKNTEIKKRLEEILKIREVIIKCNLRLIVRSVTYHFHKDSFNYEEFFSNSYLHMLRAIDHFDYKKNFKFSTYFMNVLFRNLMRDKLRFQKKNNHEELFEDCESKEIDFLEEKNYEYNKKFISDLLANLERKDEVKSKKYKLRSMIIKNYYGVCGEEKKTALEISQILGISKSRVQQITQDAIKELRDVDSTYDPLV